MPVKRHGEVLQESEDGLLVGGETIEQIASRGLFATSLLTDFWWRIERVGQVAFMQQSTIARFPVDYFQRMQRLAARGAGLIDGGFHVQQQLFHLPRPSLLELLMQEDQFAQVVDVAQTMLTGVVPIGLPTIMHAHSPEVR